MTLRLNGSTSGYSEIDAPATAGDQVFTLPTTGGTLDRLNRAGNILQVVESTSTTSVTSNATAFTSMLSASITPTSSSSKILIQFSSTYTINTKGTFTYWTIFRGTTSGTNLGLVTAGGFTYLGILYISNSDIHPFYGCILDSPATTSSQTYTLAVGQGSPAQGVTFQTNTSVGMVRLLEVAA